MGVHGDKLNALLRNDKLPSGDRPMVEEAIRKYDQWVNAMDSLVCSGDELLLNLVNLLNDYKLFIEYNLIFCSRNDFLYRQKGQIKLDNTILEEFLPRLVDSRLVPGIDRYPNIASGPQKTYSGLSFGYFHSPLSVDGISIKEKDQDFAVGRRIYLKAANNATFTDDDTFNKALTVGYFVA